MPVSADASITSAYIITAWNDRIRSRIPQRAVRPILGRLAVRYPSNVRSCKHDVRLTDLSHKKTPSIARGFNTFQLTEKSDYS